MLVYLMQSLWPLPCPLVLFSLFLMELLEDPNLYCSLVSALQYCTIMQLGISYTVHKLFQFMHASTWLIFKQSKELFVLFRALLSMVSLCSHIFLLIC